MMRLNKKGLANPLLILIILGIIVFSYFFLASPHQVSGNPVKPFKRGEFIFSERITYLFKKPEIGDRIIFFPTTQGIDYVGVITDISDAKEVKTYTALSGENRPWTITQDKIVGKVYFPFLSKQQVLSFLPSPFPSPTVSQSSPTDETANKTHISKYFSVSYPNTWYEWSFGRGVDLGYYQINSIPESELTSENRSHIAFDIQRLDYTISKTLEEHRKVIEDFKSKYPEQNYIISEQNIDGQRALVYESTIDNSPSYQKTIWLVKDNIKYIISWRVVGKSVEDRNKLTNQYKVTFDKILSTFKFLDQDQGSSDTSNWKSYENKVVDFSIKYPPNWVTKDLEAYGDTYGYEMRGNQSWIRLVWGSGFGGGCVNPSTIELVTIRDQSIQMCHTPPTDRNGTEGWSAMQGIGNKGQKGDVKVQAVMDVPSDTNRQIILSILSTFGPLSSKPN